MALCVAAAALEGRWGFEDVPQRPSAGLTAWGEVIEREDELMALVADVGGAIAIWRGLHYNLLISLTLAFIGIQDLWKGRECSLTEHLLKQTAELKTQCQRRGEGQKEKATRRVLAHDIFDKNKNKKSLQKTPVLLYYLEYLWDFFGICTVNIGLSDRSDMKQLTVGGWEMEELSQEFTSDNKCNYLSRYRVIYLFVT